MRQDVYIYHSNGSGLALTIYDVETPEEVLDTLEEVIGVSIPEDCDIWADKVYQIGAVLDGVFAKCNTGNYLVTIYKPT